MSFQGDRENEPKREDFLAGRKKLKRLFISKNLKV